MQILVGFISGALLTLFAVGWHRAYFVATVTNRVRNEQWCIDSAWAKSHSSLPPPPNECVVK
jgi:hypothetical protein